LPKNPKKLLITIEVHPSDPLTHSLMCYMAALPADATEEPPRASIISAPLFPTLGLKNVSIH